MNKFKYAAVIIMITGSAFFNQCFAQIYDVEALRYSQFEYKGTARTAGVSGAMTSIGGDAGAITLNPAAVATFRSSELMGTIGFDNVSSKSNYLGQVNSDSKIKFTGDNLGIVIAGGKGKKTAGIGGFGIGFNLTRVADFNSTTYFSAHNDTNSITDQYVAVFSDPRYRSQTIDYSNFPMDYVLAYQTYLVNYDSTTGYYSTPATVPMKQSGSIRTSGGITDMAISGGVNISDKFYVGGALSFPYLNYKRDYTYTEEDDKNKNPVFKSMTYTSNYAASGVGFNAKIGFIYKPCKFYRVGASISSPTWYNLRETNSATMTTSFDSISNTSQSPLSNFNFAYKQPFRFNAGMSFFLKQYGFISVDYELVNYKNNSFDFGTSYKDVSSEYNKLIAAKYGIGHSLRAGVELAYKTWRLRGGYAYQFTPFQKGIAVNGFDQVKTSFSVGAGYKGRRISIDLAYVHVQTKDYFAPYYSLFSRVEDGVRTTAAKDNIMLTFGFRLSK